MDEKNIIEAEKQINQALMCLNQSGSIQWKYSPDISVNRAGDFDDSSWNVVTGSGGRGWYRTPVRIPEKIMGIPTAGAEVFFRASVSQGGEVFVNGESKQKDEFWFEAMVPLTEALRRGPALLAARIDEFFWRAAIFITSVDDAAFELHAFTRELEFCRYLSGKNKKAGQALDKAVSCLDLSLLENRIPEFLETVKKAGEFLKPFSKEIKKYTAYLVGHAHIDMNWMWPWDNTVDTACRTFKSVDALMTEFPDFKFSQSQAVLYLAMEEQHPEIFRMIQKRVKEGRWDITASTWTEGDVNMASGESLVRQTLYAKKYIREKFGVEPGICWCPDTFGHPWTYPQILKKCGIDYYCFSRCGKGQVLFRWVAPDGTSVMALNKGYFDDDCKITPNLSGLLINAEEKLKLKDMASIYGVSDHGGGPTRLDIIKARKLDARDTYPSVKFSGHNEFFRKVRSRKNLPVIKDELNFVFTGGYTSESRIKLMNRKGENLLHAAEAAAAVSGIYGYEHNTAEFENAWRTVCFNQFHDIFCGSAIHSAYEYSTELFRKNVEPVETVLTTALEKVSGNIDTSGKGIPVVVFNNLSWARTDIARIPLKKIKAKDPGKTAAVGPDGTAKPCQRDGEDLIFMAEEVPSMGYKTYHLVEHEEKSVSTVTGADNTLLENEFLKIKIDPAGGHTAGCITGLYDKIAGKELLHSEEMIVTEANLLQVLWEKNHPMTAWLIGRIGKIDNLNSAEKVEMSSSGPVKASVKVRHVYRNSEIEQEIAVYSRSRRIDFITTVNWQEKGSREAGMPMLRVSFPLNISSGKAVYEIPYGFIERPASENEVPALKWADLSDGKYGAGLLNDCKYGYSVTGDCLRLTLLRSTVDPDPDPETGMHKFTYSLYPHEGDWKKGMTDRRAWELNNPLIAIAEKPHKGSLQKALDFVKIEPGNLIVTCFKEAENGNGLILRFYEAHGKLTACRIKFGFDVKKAEETDLLERKIKNVAVNKNQLRIKVGKFEIKTLKILTGKK